MRSNRMRFACMAVAANFALMAGFFFAFSVVVMPGLDVTAPDSAVLAMQGINRAVRNGVFFSSFFLGMVFAISLAVWLFVIGTRRSAIKMLLAAIVYGVGVIVLTATINVPMNEALAQVTDLASASEVWSDYSPTWTTWNSVRGVFCIVAFALAISAVPSKSPNAT